jgi:hypothetical protein
MKTKGLLILITAVIVACLVTYYISSQIYVVPSIDTIWVVNLDKDVDRMEHIRSQQDRLPKPIQRWRGAYGKEEDREQIVRDDGVQLIITKSSVAEENKKSSKVLNKAGEVGCWLSHKRLLTHLHKGDYPPNFGHLICEDDMVVPHDFMVRWEKIRQTIPTDWDMIYLGVGGPHGDRINENVLRWRNDAEAGNWGTHGYMVRHRSIGLILDKLVLMGGPIDVQYYKMLGNLNIYIVNPDLILTEPAFESSIHIQQQL